MSTESRIYTGTYHQHPLLKQVDSHLTGGHALPVLCGGGGVLGWRGGFAEEAHYHVEDEDAEGDAFDHLPGALLGLCLLLAPCLCIHDL